MKSLLKAHKNPEMTSNTNIRERDNQNNRETYLSNNIEQPTMNYNEMSSMQQQNKKPKSPKKRLSPERVVNSMKFPTPDGNHEHITGNFKRPNEQTSNNYPDQNIKTELHTQSALDNLTRPNHNYGTLFTLTGDESIDMARMKTANSSLLEQVSLLKQKIQDDKVRYENSLSLTTSQGKLKETESLAFVERLRDRHKHEITLIEDSNKKLRMLGWK